MVSKVVGFCFFAFLLSCLSFADGYTAVRGDTLNSLAQKWKIPVDVLLQLNPGTDGERLKAGDSLWVPDRYTVKSGDTLFSLCRLWAVDQVSVLTLNGMAPGAGLRKGQVLFIPRSKTSLSKGAKEIASPPASGGSLFWPVDKSPHSEGDKLKSVTFATSGEPFRSVTSGTVAYLGEFRGVGRVLLVQGTDKTVFAYGNFEDSAVEFGQSVAKGQVLGTTSPRPAQKLSFFAFLNSEPLDIFTAKR